MSSVHDELYAIQGLLEECVQPVIEFDARRRTTVETKLFRLGEEAFIRQSNRIPSELARLVEAASGNKYSTRLADSIIADGPDALAGELHFVRCSADTPADEPITQPTDDMVLCTINRYRKLLIAGCGIRSQADIDQAITEREARWQAEREAERRSQEAARLRNGEVAKQYEATLDRIKRLVEGADIPEATAHWTRMRNQRNEHYGAIMLRDLYTLAYLLHTPVSVLLAP